MAQDELKRAENGGESGPDGTGDVDWNYYWVVANKAIISRIEEQAKAAKNAEPSAIVEPSNDEVIEFGGDVAPQENV
jgi:hypothetical protein